MKVAPEDTTKTTIATSPQEASPPPDEFGLRLLYGALGVGMLAGIALNLANVIGRYAVGKPIFWAEEVLVGITIWGVFFGAAVVSWRGDHLTMDLFYAKFSGRWKLIVNILIALSMLSVCLFIAWQSLTILRMFQETEAVSVGAQIPKVIPHTALFVGFLLSALAVVVRWRLWLFGKTEKTG
jgi:TRAP-type C4-dicarboxylate transport system permease small subunit